MQVLWVSKDIRMKFGQQNPDKKKKPLNKRRKKPSPTMALNAEMLDLWSQLVKWRADYKCEYCGSTVRLHSHHVIRRGKYQLRWDLENGVCLCQRHHMYDSDFSAHKDGARFTQWIKDKRGGKWWTYLQDRLGEETNREEQFERLRNYSDKIKEMK